MRKSLVAIALACAFPAAFAQSSVTRLRHSRCRLRGARCGQHDRVTRLQGSGMWSGNRFGIRGSENLGGGYSAIFTLEGRFSLDTGSVTYNESVNWCRLSGATTRSGVSRRDRRARNGDRHAAADQPDLPGGSRRTERHSTTRCCRRSRRSTAPARSSTGSRGSAWSRPTARCCSAGSTRRAMRS